MHNHQQMNIIIVTILTLGVTLAGCSSSAPITTNEIGSVKREQPVNIQRGIVTKIKNVTILGKRSSIGSTVGRTTGSIAGGAIGSGYGSVVGSVFGSILGGAMGSSADANLQKKAAIEITVRLADGQHLTITQLADKSFKVGDKVKLIMKEGKAHVTH